MTISKKSKLIGALSDKVNSFYGLYIGFVEHNRDPQKRGRVKVRIPEIHGVENPDKDLAPQDYRNPCTQEIPWCLPLSPFGTGRELGAFIPPPIGSLVVVGFIGGNLHNGVYLGGFQYLPSKQTLWNATKTGVNPPDLYGKQVYSPLKAPYWTPTGWKEEQGPTTPVEARERILSSVPDIWVLYKSLLGNVLFSSDRPYEEASYLVQRFGAVLGMEYGTEKTMDRPKRRYREGGNRPFRFEKDDLYSKVGRAFFFDPWGQGVEIFTSVDGDDSICISTHKHDPDVLFREKSEQRSEIKSRNKWIGMGTASDDAFSLISVSESDTCVHSDKYFGVHNLVDVSGYIKLRGDVRVSGSMLHISYTNYASGVVDDSRGNVPGLVAGKRYVRREAKRPALLSPFPFSSAMLGLWR